MKKPFEVPELVARVRAALRRAGRRPDESDRLQPGAGLDRCRRPNRRPRRPRHPADADGIRPADRADPARRAGSESRQPARSDLGLRLPGRLASRRRGDPALAGEDRGRPGAARADRDGPRRRLQGRPLRRPHRCCGRPRPPDPHDRRPRRADGARSSGWARTRSSTPVPPAGLDDAVRQARFDLSDTIPDRLAGSDARGHDHQPPRRHVQRRGVEAMVDFGAGDPFSVGLGLAGSFGRSSHRRRSGRAGVRVDAIGGKPSLVVGGRLPPAGPALLLRPRRQHARDNARPASPGPRGGALALVVLALLAARSVARGVLAPVEEASRAAERIERGDLSARVAVTSRDEFGAWADRFNRMAAALEETIGRLETAQGQNRRFVVGRRSRAPHAARRARRGSLDPARATSTRSRRRAAAPASSSSPMSPGSGPSSTT